MDAPEIALVCLIIGVAIYQLSVFHFAHWLPDRVATHFGWTGEANGWMNRPFDIQFQALMGMGVPAFVVGIA